MNVKKYHDIKAVPEGKFLGYYWLSDKTEPTVLSEQEFDINAINYNNNYIVEGLLWDEQKMRSITIIHTHRYVISEIELDKIEEAEQYVPHKIVGDKKLKFQRVWEEDKDDLCCDFPVLKMKAQVFVGFEK